MMFPSPAQVMHNSRERSLRSSTLTTTLATGLLLAGCAGSLPPGDIERRGVQPRSSAYPLGTLATTAAVNPDCPAGMVCQGMVVTCPGVIADAQGFIAVAEPTGTPRGVLVFFQGGGGTGWVINTADEMELVNQLRADGFRVALVNWAKNWLVSSPGEEAGFGRLACRSATAVEWIHRTHFLPLKIARSATGRCGFCITGNSGGATQVSFTLTHYGLDDIVDAVFPTGGPPHAAAARACLRRAGEESYWYPDNTRTFLDQGFGFATGTGPCVRGDSSYVDRWNRESVATGGSDYHHPRTRVHFLVGAEDFVVTPVGERWMLPHARLYEARLRSAGSPWVTLEQIPGTQHNILSTQAGRDMLRAAILAGG